MNYVINSNKKVGLLRILIDFEASKMIPSEIFAEDIMSTVIRYGLYISAVFQLVCMLACVTLADEHSESHLYEKSYTDSDECSSEQSSPGHRATTSRARRHDKKKRR